MMQKSLQEDTRRILHISLKERISGDIQRLFEYFSKSEVAVVLFKVYTCSVKLVINSRPSIKIFYISP